MELNLICGIIYYMATEPTRNLSPEELAIQKAREGLLADQILGEQHHEPARARGFSEFKSHVPSAVEGGGSPLEIPKATAKAIAEASEGVSPDAARALGLPADPKERLNVLLGKLQAGNGGDDPHDLVQMLTGGDQLEDK